LVAVLAVSVSALEAQAKEMTVGQWLSACGNHLADVTSEESYNTYMNNLTPNEREYSEFCGSMTTGLIDGVLTAFYFENGSFKDKKQICLFDFAKTKRKSDRFFVIQLIRDRALETREFDLSIRRFSVYSMLAFEKECRKSRS
jgi:hypothetical protein